MLGVTSTYSLGAVRRARYAAELGADGIQAALPFWMAMADGDVVEFFSAVSDAAPGLALSVYDTARAKRPLTRDQHRAISEAIGQYVMLKATGGTLGYTPDGCAALSEFVNVFVSEIAWAGLGPCGAKGACSALIYMNPRMVLAAFRCLERRDWRGLAARTDPLKRLVRDGLKPYVERGCTDTSLDRLMGVATGFLTMSLRSRGTYPDTTAADAARLTAWMRDHTPELLEL